MNADELFEKLLESAPKITLGGKVYYIVENDHKVAENQLKAYVDSICQPAAGNAGNVQRVKKSSELIAATIGNRKIRWRAPAVLTWEMDEASFNGDTERLAKARGFCTLATGDWNQAAREKGIYDKIHFEPAEGRSPAFKFAFHPFDEQPGLLALAFFPNATKDERVVYIGPGALDQFIGYDQVGIIRHELGHVIGCRHEQIAKDAQEGMSEAEKSEMEQWVTGGIGAEALTQFDGQSVMHYPIDPARGLGTFHFRLSETDKQGFAALYAAPYDEATIREFEV